jgi:LuxR family maltose regulon positive regulatory protein
VTVAPTTPRLIDRGDLVAALDRAAAGKVTIISAPAGSGKTSLLRAWAGRPGQPVPLQNSMQGFLTCDLAPPTAGA